MEQNLAVQTRIESRKVNVSGQEKTIKVYVQAKPDEFDSEALKKLEEFTKVIGDQFNEFTPNVQKEGIVIDRGAQNSIKQKVLYNKEKALIAKIDQLMNENDNKDASKLKETLDAGKVRVRVPDLAWFDQNIEQQKEKLTKIVVEAFRHALSSQGYVDAERRSYRFQNVIRNNPNGGPNNYLILFFDDRVTADLFCEKIGTQIFNKSVLRGEILPNRF